VYHAGRCSRTPHRYTPVTVFGTIVSVEDLLDQNTTINVDDEDLI
jgi:hypothetical protein